MKTNDASIDLDKLRGLVGLQPRGKAQLARAAGIALPNLSTYLRTGLDSLLSSQRLARLLREVGLTASGWLKVGCHVWRTENVEDVVRVCQWVVPKGGLVSVRELRSEGDLLNSASLVQLYLLRWMVGESPRRVLLQLRASEQLAVDARHRLIACGVFAVKDESIDVVPVKPAEYDRLSEIEGIGGRAFDDLFDRDSEITWDAVVSMLPTLFGSASDAFVALHTIAASREISKAARRVRGKKSE